VLKRGKKDEGRSKCGGREEKGRRYGEGYGKESDSQPNSKKGEGRIEDENDKRGTRGKYSVKDVLGGGGGSK